MTRKLIMHEGELMTQKEYEKHRSAERARIVDDIEAEQKCFLENAFLFYSATERILNDDALCFIPVPFENNLAYSGTSGLRGATLGVYVKWWQVYKGALSLEKKSWLVGKPIEPRLLYFIAGSPLSGSNGCSEVNPDGVSYKRVLSPFIDAWRSFMNVNKSHTAADKETRRGNLTLCDAARILRADPAVMTQCEKVMLDLASGKPYDIGLLPEEKNGASDDGFISAAEFFGE